MGLLGAEADVAGTIDFDGRDLRRLTDREWADVRGKQIAIVFQESALALNPLRVVGEQVADVVRSHERCTGRTARDRARSALAEVGLGDQVDRIFHAYPHTLSGGQRQRVLIAQAVVCRPKLIIADEPVASLDDEARDGILRLIGRLNADQHISFLLITHSARVLRTTASRVIEMEAGRVIHDSHRRRAARQHPGPARLAGQSAPPRHGPPAVSVARLEKSYASRDLLGRARRVVPALRGVDLTIERGAALGLTGPSGCGKSTLARCIAGLEPVDAGDVSVTGEAQMIFQDSAAALNPRFTAEDIVTEALVIRRIGSATDRRRRAAELMTEVGLSPDRLNDRSGRFSGGERQRLSIARALAVRPALLILDEAFSGLDAAARDRIVSLLIDLQESHGLTYLCISHDVDLLAELTTDVAVMRDGRIVGRRRAQDVPVSDAATPPIAPSQRAPQLVATGAAI